MRARCGPVTSIISGTRSTTSRPPSTRTNGFSLRVGSARIELLRPLGADTPVGRFRASRGPGMHHIAFGVDDVRAALHDAAAAGAELIDEEPHAGLFGLQVAFIHPSSVAGVLVEYVQLEGAVDG